MKDTGFTTETMEELAAVFKIFGDYTRLTILSLLMDHEELCVGEIADEHVSAIIRIGMEHVLEE